MSHDAAASSALDISVDRDAEIPIGVQLAWALRSRIRDGRFQPGQRLPGLREVAEATGINVNTARAVYQRLEQERLIDSHQGSGTFVAAAPPQLANVTAIAADAAREAHATGVDPRDVAAALYVSPAAVVRQGSSAIDGATEQADDTERRRALRAQIASLERTISEIEAKHPGVAPARELDAGSASESGPTLLDADALEQVRTMLVRRLASVQAAIDALGSETLAGAREADGEQRSAAADAAAERAAPRAKPASRRAPRARGPMRPAPEGA